MQDAGSTPFDPETYSLDAVRTLALISWTAAVRDASGFQAAVQSAVNLAVDPRDVREVLLQLYLFCGFPTCIQAFAMLDEAAPPDWLPSHPAEEREIESVRLWYERGMRLFQTVYGDVHQKLMHRIQAYHPDLARWMIMEGYGKVLARQVLPAWVRELCIIPVLAVSGHVEPAVSHIRGARRLRVPREWIEAVLDDCRAALAPDTAAALSEWLGS